MARKSKRKPAPEVTSTAGAVPWYKKLWFVLTALATLISTVLLKGPEMLSHAETLPSQAVHAKDTFLAWYRDDKEWTGIWSPWPEGIVDVGDMHLSDADMRMELESQQGHISGMIATRKLCAAVPMENFALMEGQVSGSTATVIVFDIIGGERQNYASLILTRKDDVITVNGKEGHVEYFPQGARIGRQPAIDRKQEDETWSAFCKDEHDALLRAILSARKH